MTAACSSGDPPPSDSTSLSGVWELELLLPGTSDPETWSVRLEETDGAITLATCTVDYEASGGDFVPVSADCAAEEFTGALRSDGGFDVVVGEGEPDQVTLSARLEGKLLHGTAALAECDCQASVLGSRVELQEVGE